MDTLRNLEPDPGPVGIHPVSPGSTQENLPPFRHASGLHHELVPVFQRHCPQVHSLLARECSGLGWLRRDGEIKCHIYTEGASSFSVIGQIWADVAADWLVSSGVVRCDWLCFQALMSFHVICDQDEMQDCWLSDCYFIALTCSAVLAMTHWYRVKYKESARAVFNHIHISAETDLSHIHALLHTWSTPSSAFIIFEFQTLCISPVIKALCGHSGNCFNVILHSGWASCLLSTWTAFAFETHYCSCITAFLKFFIYNECSYSNVLMKVLHTAMFEQLIPRASNTENFLILILERWKCFHYN